MAYVSMHGMNDGWTGRPTTTTDLEGQGNGHADDEEEEGHHEVREVAAVPRRVPDDRPLAAGAVHQYHQLHMNANGTQIRTAGCWLVTDDSLSLSLSNFAQAFRHTDCQFWICIPSPLNPLALAIVNYYYCYLPRR